MAFTVVLVSYWLSSILILIASIFFLQDFVTCCWH
jgi:hypothetical protein